MGFYEKLAIETKKFGGYLQCSECDHKKELGDTAKHYANGWPKHCGYTMTWVTNNMIDKATAYSTDCRGGGCE